MGRIYQFQFIDFWLAGYDYSHVYDDIKLSESQESLDWSDVSLFKTLGND